MAKKSNLPTVVIIGLIGLAVLAPEVGIPAITATGFFY